LACFDQHQLLFVYEEQDPNQIARRADELFDARGRQDGGDREDWLQTLTRPPDNCRLSSSRPRR
jgi:hypothetical protein